MLNNIKAERLNYILKYKHIQTLDFGFAKVTQLVVKFTFGYFFFDCLFCFFLFILIKVPKAKPFLKSLNRFW